MAERVVFRQADIDRSDYRDDTGRWVLERSFTDGPRGGRQTVWHLYEVRGERLHEVAAERRLRDIWKHLPESRPHGTSQRPAPSPVPRSLLRTHHNQAGQPLSRRPKAAQADQRGTR